MGFSKSATTGPRPKVDGRGTRPAIARCMMNTSWEQAHQVGPRPYLAAVRTAISARDDASREAAFTHLGRIALEVSDWPLGDRQEFEIRLRSSGSRIMPSGIRTPYSLSRPGLTLEDGGYLDLELKTPAGGIPGFETSGGLFRCYSGLPGFRRPHVFQDTVHPLLDKLDYLQAVALFPPADAPEPRLNDPDPISNTIPGTMR